MNEVFDEKLDSINRIGDSKGRGFMYNYGWFMLLYGRNKHNIVKHFSSN